MTITPPSNIPVSIDYTSRDYYAIRAALIARIQDRIPAWTASDPSDFGVALVEAFAYLGDLVSYYVDRAANESLISTAVQRSSVLALAANYGYVPAGYRQAAVSLSFSNTSSSAVTLPVGTVVSADVITSSTSQTVFFTTLADTYIPAAVGLTPGTTATLSAHGESVLLVDTANSTVNGELIGTSDGTPQMLFALGETPVVDGSVDVYVQDGSVFVKWIQVQHIMDYGPNDTVYSLSTDENDIVYVTFGDGISGYIPVLHSEIRSIYTVGGGSVGNIGATSGITTLPIVYVPGLSSGATSALASTISVTNLLAALGGSDPESTEQIRANVPLSIRSSDRAVTLQDYASIALGVSGIGKANAYATTPASVTVYVAPSRTASDNDSAPGLDSFGAPTLEYTRNASDVLAALADKTLIGTTVTIAPPTYIDVSITVKYTKLSQYTDTQVQSDLQDLIESSFGYTGMYFQDTIYPQTIASVLSSYPGVSNVEIFYLFLTGGTPAITTLTGTAGQIFRILASNISVVSL